MKSVGKTYLIKIEPQKTDYVGGIYLPQLASANQTIFYIGRIHDYGLGFSEDEIKELLPIGTKVILNWKTNDPIGKIRLNFGEDIFYIYKPEHILATISEEE